MLCHCCKQLAIYSYIYYVIIILYTLYAWYASYKLIWPVINHAVLALTGYIQACQPSRYYCESHGFYLLLQVLQPGPIFSRFWLMPASQDDPDVGECAKCGMLQCLDAA